MKQHDIERFGFLITDVGRLVGRLFDQRARNVLSLSRAQCRVLAFLSLHGDINQATLADLLEVTPIALARLIDRMAEGGWIERHPDPNDRRAYRLVLTAKAERSLAQALAVGDAVRDEALAGLAEDERRELIGLLLQVRDNLGQALAAPSGNHQAEPAPNRI
jgi:DNA-binding MarR family transcriptional regulator